MAKQTKPKPKPKPKLPQHFCGDCIHLKPDTQNLSHSGEIFWGYCPKKKVKRLFRHESCKEVMV